MTSIFCRPVPSCWFLDGIKQICFQTVDLILSLATRCRLSSAAVLLIRLDKVQLRWHYVTRSQTGQPHCKPSHSKRATQSITRPRLSIDPAAEGQNVHVWFRDPTTMHSQWGPTHTSRSNVRCSSIGQTVAVGHFMHNLINMLSLRLVCFHSL